jgi:hypothetical protein
MYDIFYVGSKSDVQWQRFKEKFPTAKCTNSVEQATKTSLTKLFWTVYPDTEIVEDFDFSFTPDDWSKDVTHVFLNKDQNDGIALIPKTHNHCLNETKNRFYVAHKKVEVVASVPAKYQIFYANTYQEYVDALQKSQFDLFYIVPSTVDIHPEFDFDIYFTHHNHYDRHINHMLLNGEYNDGIMLCSKHLKISEREWTFKFVAGKKEHDILASTPKPYDVVFISYQEPDADKNYENLKKKAPHAKRVHGVKGIHQAHIEAAKLCDTPMIWIVDGDATIADDFEFNYQVPAWQYSHVHVWRSKNPINGLVYGYGGVKLFPREATINMDTSKPDMTTSISDKFVAVKKVSNITGFNTGEFETWKSAFRECCKLSSKTIDRQKDGETDQRLKIWCSVGRNKPFGEFAISGAKAGALYGARNKGDIQALKKINDFEWLKDQFDGNI